MNHFNKLLFALFLLPLFTQAQSNYKPGYVITLKGDTLHGFIDYRGWNSNPTTISFESTLTDAKSQKYGTNDIGYFNVDSLESYQKFICSISLNDINTDHLAYGRDSSSKIDTVFLKVLQKGKNVALYSYTDNIKTRFYIGETPAYAPVELQFQVYKDQVNTGQTVNENTYQKQLFALANKYNVLDDNLIRSFETTTYNSGSLLPIVSKINHITEAEFKKKYAGKSKFNFFVSAALNISTTSSSASSSYTMGGGGPYTSYLPAFSVGGNFIPNPASDKIELRVEVSLAESQFNKTYKLTVSPYVAEKASFNQQAISLIPQIIFNLYNTENLKIYLGGGIDISHFSYSNAFFGPQNPGVSDNGIGASDPYFFNSADDSFLLKAGLKVHKKFEIFYNYFTPTTTTGGGYFGLSNSSNEVGILYFFGK